MLSSICDQHYQSLNVRYAELSDKLYKEVHSANVDRWYDHSLAQTDVGPHYMLPNEIMKNVAFHKRDDSFSWFSTTGPNFPSNNYWIYVEVLDNCYYSICFFVSKRKSDEYYDNFEKKLSPIIKAFHLKHYQATV